MSTPIAYLRRSSASTKENAGRVSYAVQESAVLELAGRNGDVEPEMIVEWGKSGAARSGAFGGTGRGGKRRAYAVLRERIKAGEVSVVYAYSLSRLARSTRELLDLAEACAEAGTRILLAKEGTLDFTSPHGRLYLTVLSAVATFEAEVSRERAMDRVANAREHGRYLGEPPLGWKLGDDGKLVPGDDHHVVDAVVDAFRATGSYRAAALRLNEEGTVKPGIAGKRGRADAWSGAVVRTIVSRELGTRTPPTRKGSRTHQAEPLARLLFCAACGGVLTLTRHWYKVGEGKALHRSWRCFRSAAIPEHPKPKEITEARLMPALVAEAALLRVPHDRLATEQANTAERDALDARRARLLDALEAGTITRVELEPRLAVIEAERARIATSEALLDIAPVIDWTWRPETLATALAGLWRSVTVDIMTGAIEADWLVPEWRAAT